MNSQIIFELLRAVYDVFFILTLSLLIDEENVRDLIRTVSKDFTSTLVDLNPQIGKKILDDSVYYNEWIKPVFLLENTDKLNDNDKHYRKEWIDLLKKHYPKKLAEIII